MANPTIYGPRYSTYARSILLALAEKGVACDVHEVDIFKGEHQTPEHLARHPFGKVPAFSHDGLDLYETVAVLRYVDEAFDGPKLQPADVKARARMQQVMGVVDSYAYSAFVTHLFIPRAVVPMLGGETDEAAVAAALPDVEKAVRALDTLIDGNAFFAGADLSLADLHVVPVYDYLSQTPEGQKVLAGAPNLSRWWDAMQDRPSVVQTQPQLG